MSLAGLIDVGKESQRLEKQIAENAASNFRRRRQKLGNARLCGEGAPADVVQQQQQQVAELVSQIKTLDENLRGLREP